MQPFVNLGSHRTEDKIPSRADVLHIDTIDRTMRYKGRIYAWFTSNRKPAVRFLEKLCMGYSPAQEVASFVGAVPLYIFARNLGVSYPRDSRENLERVQENAPSYCRQYVMHLGNALEDLGNPAKIQDNGLHGRRRQFALELDTNVEFFWALPSAEEQTLFKHVHIHYCLGRYGTVMEFLERHYCSGQFESVIEFLEAPDHMKDESWSDVAAAHAAMYSYLCHCHFPVGNGCPTEYLPLQRTTCLTRDEQDFFKSEMESLSGESLDDTR